jgi:formiminotetrahydrofolate cyclodeaminase
VPGLIAEAAADVGELAAQLARAADPDLRADAAVAATLAEAAATSAAHLVAINLVVTADDPRLAAAQSAAAAARAARDAALRGA